VLKQQKTMISTVGDIQEALKKQLKQKSISATDIQYDDMTSLTSGELNKTYNKASKETQERLKECRQSPDGPNCKELLEMYVGNKKDLEKGKTEFSLLSNQRNKKLRESLEDQDKEVVKSTILTEANQQKGDDDYQKQKELLDDDEIAKIKDNIEKTYKNEADAIKAELKKKIELADKSATDQFDEISKNLNDTAESKKALMHYNNIVSGYLTPKEDSGGSNSTGSNKKDQNNFRSVQRELQDSAYTADDSAKSDYYKEQAKKIEAKTDFSQIDKKNSNTLIQVKDINEKILKIQKAEQSSN